MTPGVVLDFESVHIDKGGHEFPAGTPRAVDLPPDRSQPGSAALYTGQLIDRGMFTVLGGLCAIVRCNPPVMAALCAVVSRLSPPRGGPGAFVCRALTVVRRAISCGSVEITRRDVTRLGFLVTQLGRIITLLCSQSGVPAARACQLVRPNFFAVLSGLCSIVHCNPAVVDGLCAVVRSLSAPGGSPGPFVCRMLRSPGRPTLCDSVKHTRRVVTSFGHDVTPLRSQIAFTPFSVPPARNREGNSFCPRSLAVLSGLCAIVRSKPAVVDGLCAIVRSLGAPGGSPGTFVCRMLRSPGRPTLCDSVKITRRVVTRFGLLVTQLGREVTLVGSQIAAYPFDVPLAGNSTGIPVSPGGFAVLSRFCAIVRSLCAPLRARGPVERRQLTVGRCPTLCGSVEIIGRVLTRVSLLVTQLCHDVALLRSQVAVTPFDVALAPIRKGIGVCPGGSAVLIRVAHALASRTLRARFVEDGS